MRRVATVVVELGTLVGGVVVVVVVVVVEADEFLFPTHTPIQYPADVKQIRRCTPVSQSVVERATDKEEESAQ
jgi:hypothetical protein